MPSLGRWAWAKWLSKPDRNKTDRSKPDRSSLPWPLIQFLPPDPYLQFLPWLPLLIDYKTSTLSFLTLLWSKFSHSNREQTRTTRMLHFPG